MYQQGIQDLLRSEYTKRVEIMQMHNNTAPPSNHSKAFTVLRNRNILWSSGVMETPDARIFDKEWNLFATACGIIPTDKNRKSRCVYSRMLLQQIILTNKNSTKRFSKY
jgi:hypothetical protein